MNATMNVTVNGSEKQFEQGTTLADLLRVLSIPPDRSGIAVALNERVITRVDLGATLVRDGDRVEVIHAVQGG